MPETYLKRVNNRIAAMGISKSRLHSPARLVIFGFAILILTGTLLLMLPVASTGNPLGFLDALFTSTSAVCVTGLTVVDTGKAFSVFGQFMILILIQAGGLGIMTVSTFFLLLAGRRPGLTGQTIIQDTFTHSGELSPVSILKEVMVFTSVIEGIGILVMFFYFLPKNGAHKALFTAVFHSISAFCNAGFSLFPDSFAAYRESWALNLIVSFLIVAGGLGFFVLSELKRNFSFQRRTWSRLSLHTKLVLSSTAVLLTLGTLLILLMEWHNTLGPLSWPARVLSSFFQAVSARTAGFNTLPIGNMANETLFVLIVLMFIGASPGSCGGGIKTTSLAALFVLGISRLRGKEYPQIFGRTIAEASIKKAVSVVMLSTMVVCAGIIALQVTEIGGTSHLQSRGKFLELFFEVVSAFGTVGLSTGITGGLSALGKMIITGIMFVGRLGPLLIGVAVSSEALSRYYYAEESIMVG